MTHLWTELAFQKLYYILENLALVYNYTILLLLAGKVHQSQSWLELPFDDTVSKPQLK